MSVLDYIETGERLNQTNLNRALRQLLTDSGLDPDADFPGFARAYAYLVETVGLLTIAANIAIPNAATFKARNNANTADLGLVATDSSDRLLIGGTGITRIDFYLDGALQLLLDDTVLRAITDDDIELGSSTIRYKQLHSLLANFYDGNVKRAKLIDYNEAINALGNKSGAFNVDYELGNVFTCTFTGNSTITVTNWPPTGTLGRMTGMIVGNGTATLGITNIDWGTQGAPSTIVSGETLIVNLITKDAGTNVAGSWASGFTL